MEQRRISICENGLTVVIEITPQGDIRLLHFSPLPFDEETLGKDRRNYRLIEVQGMQEQWIFKCPMGQKQNMTLPGLDLVCTDFADSRNEHGRVLELTGVYRDIKAVCRMQMYDGIPVVRFQNTITNIGDRPHCIQTVSSFICHGIDHGGSLPWDLKSKVYVCHNSWMGELQWEARPITEYGLRRQRGQSSNRISVGNTGSWSTQEYLPLGCYENTECGTALFWQIENNGSWHWEISDTDGRLYVLACGPTEQENHFWKIMKPGESFISVPAAAGCVPGGFEEAMGALTRYRRKIRRQHWDNIKLPVIFNDYMNCLFAEPTTEKELPLIEAAADAGAEIYVIDAGWYTDGSWWSSVGEWMPSKKRFPDGLGKLLDYIRTKGMIPGLWLELEAMGTECPVVKRVGDGWFFSRHGKPVVYRGRYQLDYRNPAVRAYADAVIDRLVKEYGVGYIKMDYNINIGIGTEYLADSPGDGLLQHNRAYLRWLDGIFQKYPDLIIENCSSGGLRMDYALLSRHSIQSISDQEDYTAMAAIAGAGMSGAAPEQLAVWTYPKRDGDREETVFNMVNAMLMRIHQSGHLADLSEERRNLVKAGIAYYKTIRSDIARGVPVWPLGPPHLGDTLICYGLRSGTTTYLAVYRNGDARTQFTIPVKHLAGKCVDVRCAYPENDAPCQWHTHSGLLVVELKSPISARLFEIKQK
ncbi:MAG: glycoside hydrolase family 36 protein [Bacillota bacterium]